MATPATGHRVNCLRENLNILKLKLATHAVVVIGALGRRRHNVEAGEVAAGGASVSRGAHGRHATGPGASPQAWVPVRGLGFEPMKGWRSLLAMVCVALALGTGALASGAGSPAPSTPGWKVPTPCSGGPPAKGLWGACATYNQATTWYGTYGPGFPSALGWVLCAWPAASGGWYPDPSYAYQVADPPNGSHRANLDAYGYALSEAANEGLFANVLAWGANDMGQAAKLLYDSVAWDTMLVADPGGVTNALSALFGLYRDALLGGGAPTLALSLPGGAASFQVHTTATASLRYPTSGVAMANTRVLLGVNGATFDANGSNQLWVTTSSSGTASVAITAATSSATTVSMGAFATLGRSGLEFLRASASYAQNAQDVTSPLAAATSGTTATWSSEAPPPPRGRLALVKDGNDTQYLSVEGALFEVKEGTTVVATLVTDATGAAGPTGRLIAGTYTLHEAQAPPGYLTVPDRSVDVVANVTTTVSLLGADGDQVIPATLSLHKVDDATGAPLAGAVLQISYDQNHDGAFTPLGQCTTDNTGACVPPGNTGTDFLPGYYMVQELSPPPGYLIGPEGSVQYIELGPGEAGSVTFADDRILTTLFVAKHNATEPGQGVPGATYDLYVVGTPPQSAPATPDPLAASQPQMTWYAQGVTDAGGHLGFTIPVGFSWCVAERSVPSPWILDPALRCTGIINDGEPDPVRTVAVAEQPSMIDLVAQKYNAEKPGTVIPNASYALFVVGPFPLGWEPPTPPAGLTIPQGHSFFALGTTDEAGQLNFQVPAGFAWCFQELVVPPGYLLDEGLHCTGILASKSPTEGFKLALPELPAPAGPDTLPATGGGGHGLLGLALVAGGALLAWSGRSRRGRPGAAVADSDA